MDTPSPTAYWDATVSWQFIDVAIRNYFFVMDGKKA